MAVKIRLARRGRKKLALYDVVVADVRSPRDGRFIEKLGTFNPLTNPATVNINEDRAFHWLMVGAQPTDVVRTMLSHKGILFRKHLQVGVNKGAISQEEADRRLQEWKSAKDAKFQSTRNKLQQAKDQEAKSRIEAEAKVKEARAEAIRQKAVVQEQAAAASEAAEAPAEEAAGQQPEESAEANS